MRIPTSLAFDRITASLKKSGQRLASAQERLSTGKRSTRPSDDVAGLSQILHDRVSLTLNGQFQRNVAAVQADLGRIDRIMSASYESLSEIRKLAMRVAYGEEPSGPDSNGAALAATLRDQLLSFANATFGGNSLFSGFSTDRQAFNTQTFAYEGDDGIRSVALDDGVTLPVSVPGGQAFGLPAMAVPVVVLSDGSRAHFTSHADSSVTVEIRSSDDTTVLDSFSFSNSVQLAHEAAEAIRNGDRRKAEALLAPLEEAQNRVRSVQTELGVRLVHLDAQDRMLRGHQATLSSLVSRIEDADPSETAMELTKAEIALQAGRESAAKIFSKSLFDFLR